MFPNFQDTYIFLTALYTQFFATMDTQKFGGLQCIHTAASYFSLLFFNTEPTSLFF